MEQPTKVIRYLRPQMMGKTGQVCPMGNYGVVLVFQIDQEKNEVEVKWSVCNGDTFNKKKGLEEAEKNPVFKLTEYDRSISLSENLNRDIHEMVIKNGYPSLKSVPHKFRPMVAGVVNCSGF